MVRNVKWIADNGDIIHFNQSPPYMLDRFIPGVPMARAEVAKPIRASGKKTYYVTAEPVTPSIVGSIHGKGKTYSDAQADLDNLRMRLQSALDPTKFGTLIYNSYAGSFRLYCKPITGAEIHDSIGSSQRFDVEFESDDPYWTEAELEVLSVGAVRKLWRFPWAIKPTVFGSILSRGIIKNPTNTDIYPVIFISETISTKVTVGNETTGDYLTITHSIEPGQRLILDMAEPSIKLVSDESEEDVSHWVTHDSEYPWHIAPGLNEIYSAVDSPQHSPIITMRWYKPKVGL